MAKPEWGTKRTCPNCGTRFYDLGKDSPLVCIDCAHEWTPEPTLKSKQPLAQAAPKKEVAAKAEPAEEGADALEEDEALAVEETDADAESDVEVPDDDDSDVADVVSPSLDDDET